MKIMVVRDERFMLIIGINEYIIDDSSYIAIYINDSYALKVLMSYI